MNTDLMIKYFIWIVFFAIALTGIYFMLKKFGIM